VYYNNSVSYYVAQVNVSVANINVTPVISYGTAHFALTGDATVTMLFAPMYWTQISATQGGTASPASQWTRSGSYVHLSESPSAGYYFVGWTGSGPGATGPSQRHTGSVTIRPTGPVTELAVFAVRPPQTYNVQFTAQGIPVAQPFMVTLNGAAYSGLSAFTVGNLSAGEYTLGLPYVYDNTTAGTRYTATSFTTDYEFTATTVDITANGSLTVIYGSQYLVQLSATAGGSTNPAAGNYWWNAEATFPVTATATAGYHFVSWGGTGAGAVNATTPSVSVVVGGPVAETAIFAVNPIGLPATYTLTVTQTTLPANTGWNVSIGGMGTFGTAGSLVVGKLNGSYTLTVPVVTISSGERYVPTGTGSYPETVTANATVSVNFTEQFLVTVGSSGSGSITPSTAQWVDAGTSVTLTAIPASQWLFDYWNGTGAGQYSGATANTTFTPTGPVTETATFIPAPLHKQSGSSTDGLPLAVGLLVALLVVGLLVGLVVARRRKTPPTPPSETWEASPSEGTAAGETPESGSGGSS
jgi:hypothetical protein